MTAGRSGTERGATVLGVALIALGVAFLVGQNLGIDLSVSWPLFVIVPGIIIFALAFAVGGQPGAGVAVAGSVLTAVGLLLAYQQAMDHWVSWAYAWALVAPGAVGFGLLAYGTLTGNHTLARTGRAPLLTGIVIFLVGALFFEGILRLGGERFGAVGDWLIPAILVLIGAVLIGRSLFARR